MMSWEDPWFLLLLLLLVPLWARQLRQKNRPLIRLSGIQSLGLEAQRRHWHSIVRWAPLLIRSAVIVCLALALARPQLSADQGKRRSEGLDIVLAFDASGSMRALDFQIAGKPVDRLEAVKYVIRQFVEARPQDRIGMVVFGSEAYTQSPLTLDHQIVLQFLERIQIGIAGESTAIGDAIAASTNRIKDIEAKSKVVILLTDGRNVTGQIEPTIAAEAAAALGIRIYTIGVGRDGLVPMPARNAWGRVTTQAQRVDIDEKLLQTIASKTGGQYFRAYDTGSLQDVYETIDKLETRKMEIKEYRQRDEAYAVFLWPGIFLLFSELAFGLTRLRGVA